MTATLINTSLPCIHHSALVLMSVPGSDDFELSPGAITHCTDSANSHLRAEKNPPCQCYAVCLSPPTALVPGHLVTTAQLLQVRPPPALSPGSSTRELPCMAASLLWSGPWPKALTPWGRVFQPCGQSPVACHHHSHIVPCLKEQSFWVSFTFPAELTALQTTRNLSAASALCCLPAK